MKNVECLLCVKNLECLCEEFRIAVCLVIINLTKLLQILSREKPHAYCHCEKGSTKENLEQHLNIHRKENVQDIICCHCQRSFTQK